MVRAFYEAEKIRREKEDYFAWTLGGYVQRAIDSVVGNALREKGSTPAEYPKEPLLYTERIRKQEEEKRSQEEREKQEALYAQAYMMNFVQAGKNWGKKKG